MAATQFPFLRVPNFPSFSTLNDRAAFLTRIPFHGSFYLIMDDLRSLCTIAMRSISSIGASSSYEECVNDELPNHLLVLVNGIMGSPNDWKYVKNELKQQLGNDYYVHASSVNSYLQTFSGIDVAGKRLADEVAGIIEQKPYLRRISFVSHSLGGLFARYAVSVLYETNEVNHKGEGRTRSGDRFHGLQPICFITLATPHLGVRGKRQLPFLLGVPVLEKLAVPLAPVIGRTGQQLFLTDGEASDPPLLWQMASDCKFISSLRAFRSRVTYANVSYDHMVGWRTSSIRREPELFKPPRYSLEGYKHVVSVVDCPQIESDILLFKNEKAGNKEAAQKEDTSKEASTYYDLLEEDMIRGLHQVSWRKVDVSFHSALWPFFAHNNISVRNKLIHYEGAGVISHVADSIRREDSSILLTGNS